MGKAVSRRKSRRKIGLALAGGGPEGAVYEIGALLALDEAMEGIDFNDLDVYVGVSAGSFIAANLANGLTPDQMARAIVKREIGEHPIHPDTFMRPALGELARSGARVPRLLWQAVESYLKNPLDQTLLDSLTKLGRALPVGLFDNEPIRAFLERIYSIKGRTDDFRELSRKLVVVAADLDSGQAVCFGEPGWDHYPISQAVQASTALPGIYSPVEIDGRHYVDGVLLKTLHASVALDAGAELLICLNPIVPVDTISAVEKGVMRRGKLVDRGLPTVLAQTFRTLIHSRLTVGLASYKDRFDGNVILIEPERDDYRMFFTNIFKFSSRKYVCEHAYQATRKELLRRYDELVPVLKRHGIRLRRDVLEDERNTACQMAGVKEEAPVAGGVLDDLDRVLDRLDAILES